MTTHDRGPEQHARPPEGVLDLRSPPHPGRRGHSGWEAEQLFGHRAAEWDATLFAASWSSSWRANGRWCLWSAGRFHPEGCVEFRAAARMLHGEATLPTREPCRRLETSAPAS